MQELTAFFQIKRYCAHRRKCVKCGKTHSTARCTLSKTQPARLLLCGESHPVCYRSYKAHQGIICTRLSSLRTIVNINVKNNPRQENENLEAPQKTEGRPKMAYAQATGYSIVTPRITGNNTQRSTLIKIM
jgi:hypothetical protein